jgi:hypothetical protein
MRNITVSIGMQTQREPEGGETTRILYHYHCRSCNTYLCSRIYMEEQPAVAVTQEAHYASQSAHLPG